MIEPSDSCAQGARPRSRTGREGPLFRFDIVEDDGDWSRLQPVARLAQRVARTAADHVPGFPGPAMATLALSSDAQVRALNLKWRGKDGPTNVLSFRAASLVGPPANDCAFLGDIVLASETLFREAAQADIEPSHHFQHLVVHGLLHLMGYDHESESEADVMEGLEIRILAALGLGSPYADHSGPHQSRSIPTS